VEAARKLTGDIEQVPPMFSALHHQGKRLHELARAGVTVERPARPVTITRFDVNRWDCTLLVENAMCCLADVRLMMCIPASVRCLLALDGDVAGKRCMSLQVLRSSCSAQCSCSPSYVVT
jgi:hypothetical protein